MRTLVMTLACLLAFSVSAEARHHHYRRVVEAPLCYPSNNIMIPCGPNPNFLAGVRSIKVHMKRVSSRREPRARVLVNYAPSFPSWIEKPVIHAARVVEKVVHDAGQVIGGRPSGCPYEYCGCSASLRTFGKIIPELNLAANWGRFPPASPAPGMAAYRAHHVFIIESVNSDGTVVAHDGNSGHHLTRIHTVSLRGYRVVNPHG